MKSTPQEQAKQIARRAKFIADCCDNGVGTPRQQRSRIAQLSRSLKALEGPKWRISTLQREVIGAIAASADLLHRRVIGNDRAGSRALAAVQAAMRGAAVPAKLQGKVASRAAVEACLASWHRKGGRMPHGALSKYHALRALFVELGLARGGPDAIKRLMLRARHR